MKAFRLLSIGYYVIIANGIVLLVELSLPYLQIKPGIDFLKTKQLIYHLDWWRISFYIHVFSSPFVIISGVGQFSRRILKSFPKFHRTSGKVYVFGVLLVSGPSGFLLGLYANAGYIPQISFVLLSLLWIFFTLIAFLQIRKRNIESHSKWMLRSYALCLSAITLRLLAYIFDLTGMEFTPRVNYAIISWLSWTVNLLVAEILILYKVHLRLGPQ